MKAIFENDNVAEMIINALAGANEYKTLTEWFGDSSGYSVQEYIDDNYSNHLTSELTLEHIEYIQGYLNTDFNNSSESYDARSALVEQ